MRLLKLDFCRPRMERYLEGCNFTDDERAIIELRRKGVSLVGMAGKLNISERSVSSRIKSIESKMREYDNFIA